MQVVKDPVLNPLVDVREHLVRYYTALGVEDVEKLLPPKQEGPNPVQQKQEELAMRGAEAEVAGKEAQVAETHAKVEETQTKTAKTAAEAQMAQEAVAKQKRDQDASDFEKQLGPELAVLMGQQAPEQKPPQRPNGRARPARQGPPPRQPFSDRR